MLIDGKNWQTHFREARKRIGLVPQELTMDVFEPLISTVSFSRELFGRAPDPARIEEILRELSLWDKRKTILKELSGGMKRRVMIAKALAHDPDILFLDEPTAGVDVELRRDMWNMVRRLREMGTTIILTTHYIEEAEEMADRVGRHQQGRADPGRGEDRADEEARPQGAAPAARRAARKPFPPRLPNGSSSSATTGRNLTFEFDAKADRTGIPSLLAAMRDAGIAFKDLDTQQSSLEDIFVGLIHEQEGSGMNWRGIWAIYKFEMHRFARTLWTGLAVPVITTSLYFVVFGSAIGIADERDQRHRLWQLHRARPDDAVAVHREHLQRQLRHPHAALHRHHLRDRCPRPCRRSRRSSAMSARPRPRRCPSRS